MWSFERLGTEKDLSYLKGADYPGILPYSRSKTMFGRELDQEEKSVRGTLVTGLTTSDTMLLDIFEGDVSHGLSRIGVQAYSLA
jgi:hypothetical protein